MFALKSNFFVPDASILHAGMFVTCGAYITSEYREAYVVPKQ